jgi:hypothetical protein
MKNSMLTMGLAALLFAACSNDVTDEATQTQNDGNRYMAISLVAGGNTRADATYEDGSEDEYQAKNENIYFYFFDKDGNSVSVNKDTKVNFVQGTGFEKWDASSVESETALSNVIAVLNTDNGEMPSQVVAVINATTAPKAAISLADLRKQLVNAGEGYTTLDGKTYFLMSNSVYNDGQDNVYATPVTTANFANTADKAKESPVKIYVERVVAKVTMTIPDVKKLEDSDDYTSAYKDGMYVKVNGWQYREH